MKLFTNSTLFVLISLITIYAQSGLHIPPCQGNWHQNGGNCYGYATARAFGREWDSSPCSAATLEQKHGGSAGMNETYFNKITIEDWDEDKSDIRDGDILYFSVGHVAYVTTAASGGNIIVCDHKPGPYADEKKDVNVDWLIDGTHGETEYEEPTRYYRQKEMWKIQVFNSFGSGDIQVSGQNKPSGYIKTGIKWEDPVTIKALYDGEVFEGAIRDFYQWNDEENNQLTVDDEYTYYVEHYETTPKPFTAMYHNWLHFTFQNSFSGISDKGNMNVNETPYTNISFQDTFWVEKEGSISFEALNHSINNINYSFDHWSDQNTSASRTINDVSSNGQYTAYFTGKPSWVSNFTFDCGYNEPIHFTWDQYQNSNVKYRIYRKGRNQYGNTFGPTLLATLNNNQTSYTDDDFTKTRTYEYLISYDARAYYTTEQKEAYPQWSSVFGNWFMSSDSDAGHSSVPKIPKIFSISNYPNPFNPETTIKYALPKETDIRIRIFNANGRLVETIKDGIHEAGYYSIKWRGVNRSGQLLASGVYFVTMQLPDRMIHRKLLLLR